MIYVELCKCLIWGELSYIVRRVVSVRVLTGASFHGPSCLWSEFSVNQEEAYIIIMAQTNLLLNKYLTQHLDI